jgi:hypothetical protein
MWLQIPLGAVPWLFHRLLNVISIISLTVIKSKTISLHQERTNIAMNSSPRIMTGALFSVILATASTFAQSPFAHSQQAAPVRATTATLNGMAVPRSSPTTVWFEWGTDTSYGNTTGPQTIGNGIHVVRVQAPLVNLVEGGIYHFRVVASNSVGVTRGFDSMFTTSMKVQNWGSFSEGLPVMPVGLTNLSGIASGHRHCLAIRNKVLSQPGWWVLSGILDKLTFQQD